MNNEERLKLDKRIHNQRARLAWFEWLFDKHLHAHFRWKRPFWMEYATKRYKENYELRRENARLRAKLTEIADSLCGSCRAYDEYGLSEFREAANAEARLKSPQGDEVEAEH